MVIIMNRALGQEEYVMDISAGKILIYASAAPGVLWGIRTLQQMLPPEIYRNAPAKVHLSVPCCLIQDKPRFKYRGVMLDCCRHFFSTDEIKRQLDVMSIYKCNRLHWHLSDDQGWRIEIKSRPLLTIAGAWRAEEDNPKYGGFYTEDEVRDIISYAAARGITVIPEIDLPGHMMSALTCYPELGCTGKGYEITNRWGVYKDVLCAGNEAVYAFLEDVLTEICDIFPSEYIHIGGDECPKDRWRECPKCQAKIRELGLEDTAGATKEQRLQNYVTARIQAFLAGKGRKIIGWDEILEGELSPGATVMSWRGSKGGIKAAAAGFDVIMTPNSHCYFDYAQSPQLDKEPKGITRKPERAITLEKVYSMEPCVNMDAESAKHVLGVQCNLWTEYIAANDHLEYMLLPRMIALSEVQWRPAGNRDFDAFKTSLQHHQFRILDILGVNYRKLD
ncbi:MAG: beta-N-acetylhexosaminidase [Bacteroidales bacterium]|nr:beta-N-acetylhexosaminidase [Bacteroidales bacterium]